MTDTLGPKNALKYFCNFCYHTTSNKKDFNRHLLTLKHINTVKMLQNTAENPQKSHEINNTFMCECGKQYKHRQSLFNHKKTCENKGCSSKDSEPIIKTNKDEFHINNLIIELIKSNNELQKENKEFKNLILEIAKKDTHTTNNISNNKSFNLNLFLNETCKDAMNIMDFVESIKLQLSDLERVGEVGYVEGISNIIIKNLKELDVSQRPVHCTDKKREIMYIKDEDKWEKDEEQKKMHNVVRKVAAKNARLVLKYKELHPDCNTYHSKLSEKYNKIVIEAMGGSGDNDFENEEKIIRNISKVIGIDKI